MKKLVVESKEVELGAIVPENHSIMCRFNGKFSGMIIQIGKEFFLSIRSNYRLGGYSSIEALMRNYSEVAGYTFHIEE